MGPSGCREMKEDREVAKGGEKQWPDVAALLRGKGNRGDTRQADLYLQGCVIRQTFTQINAYKSSDVSTGDYRQLETCWVVGGGGVGEPPTFGADDLGPVPLAITLAPDYGHVVLGKSFVAPVAYSGMDIILGLAGPDGRSVLHCWRGTTQHWGRRNLQLGEWP